MVKGSRARRTFDRIDRTSTSTQGLRGFDPCFKRSKHRISSHLILASHKLQSMKLMKHLTSISPRTFLELKGQSVRFEVVVDSEGSNSH